MKKKTGCRSNVRIRNKTVQSGNEQHLGVLCFVLTKANRHLVRLSSANIPFLLQKGEVIIKKGSNMRKVFVKKRKIEKEFNNVKLSYLIYDVCEVVKNEDGSTEINVTQIFEVTDTWDFEGVNDLMQ